MKKLIKLVADLKASPVKETVNSRMSEFSALGQMPDKEIFKELCFCFLTANFNAAGGIRIQKEIDDGFCSLSEKQLAERLASLKHRFPNARAKYIAEAQKHKDNIKELLASFPDEKTARNWLAENIKGLGMKEASHFLRNIGYRNVAIIDFHILDVLVKNNLIEEPKTLTTKKYIAIEATLESLADKLKMSPGELDLYLWYLETGKILK